MPADDAVLRSARNAFLVLIVLLLAISVYQAALGDGLTAPVVALWVAGAGVFYASKYYYGRQERATGQADGGEQRDAGA